MNDREFEDKNDRPVESFWNILSLLKQSFKLTLTLVTKKHTVRLHIVSFRMQITKAVLRKARWNHLGIILNYAAYARLRWKHLNNHIFGRPGVLTEIVIRRLNILVVRLKTLLRTIRFWWSLSRSFRNHKRSALTAVQVWSYITFGVRINPITLSNLATRKESRVLDKKSTLRRILYCIL